jgi:hypothetical protein
VGGESFKYTRTEGRLADLADIGEFADEFTHVHIIVS